MYKDLSTVDTIKIIRKIFKDDDKIVNIFESLFLCDNLTRVLKTYPKESALKNRYLAIDYNRAFY